MEVLDAELEQKKNRFTVSLLSPQSNEADLCQKRWAYLQSCVRVSPRSINSLPGRASRGDRQSDKKDSGTECLGEY